MDFFKIEIKYLREFKPNKFTVYPATRLIVVCPFRVSVPSLLNKSIKINLFNILQASLSKRTRVRFACCSIFACMCMCVCLCDYSFSQLPSASIILVEEALMVSFRVGLSLCSWLLLTSLLSKRIDWNPSL